MGAKPRGYSASRISGIIGLSDYITPFNAFQLLKEELEPGFNERMGYKIPEFVDTPATRWGLAFEQALCSLSEEKENDKVINREKAFSKKVGDIELTTHIDGQFESSSALLENKTTNTRAYYSSKTETEESLDDDGQLQKDFKIVKKWGDTGTCEVPQEYQVQTAVQRICTGADLVKLSVLVFPKSADEFEKEGITASNKKLCFDKSGAAYERLGGEYALYKDDKYLDSIISWARTFAQIGNFHQYLLPSHPELEAAIIKAVQDFHTKHVLTGLPPRAQNYDDIKSLLANPQGTIIATDQMRKLATEYSELTRQLGASSPNAKRRDAVKIELLNLVNESNRDDWIEPPTAISVIDPDGGAELVKFGQDKNGNLRFNAKRAR